MTYTKTIELGKVAYSSSRKVNAVEVEVTIKDGELSMIGGIWNASRTDYATCGQITDEIGELFPNDAKVQAMVAVWNRWHLNHMRAGTPQQEAWLREHDHGSDYTETLERLASAGLAVQGRSKGWRGYKYGQAWLSEELPAEIAATVKSW